MTPGGCTLGTRSSCNSCLRIATSWGMLAPCPMTPSCTHTPFGGTHGSMGTLLRQHTPNPPLPALLFSEVNAFAAFLQMIKWLLRSPIQNKLKGIQVQKHPVISVCSQWNNYPEGFVLLNIQKVIDNLPVRTTSSSSVEGPFPTPYQRTCAACHEQI